MSTRKSRQPHDLMKTQSPCGLARDQRVLLEAVNKTGEPERDHRTAGLGAPTANPGGPRHPDYRVETGPDALARWGCVEIQARERIDRR